MLRALLQSALFILFILGAEKTAGQIFTPKYSLAINSRCQGFYEYLPLGYDPLLSQTYPLLIALHGAGESGDGSSNASTGLPLLVIPGKGVASLINSGSFPSTFTLPGGSSFRFIVICPQFTVNGGVWPAPSDLEDVISYAINHYKVDLSRIYLTGLSMGGGTIFRYASSTPVNANKVAAMVPVCAAMQPGPPYLAKPDSLTCRTITAGNLPVWATHNLGDNTVPVSFTDSMVHYINAAPSPTPLARKTIFTSWIFDHDAWTQTFDPNYTGFDGLNMYQWMLQYQRVVSPVILPVKLSHYAAVITGEKEVTVSWQTETETNNDHFRLERCFDGRTYKSIVVMPGSGQGQKYSYVDKEPGEKNFYRLSQTDKNSHTVYFDVLKISFPTTAQITVGPNPAQDYINLYISPHAGNLTVHIRSLTGALVRKMTFTGDNQALQKTIFIHTLPKGVYVLEAMGDIVNTIKTFIKN
jgi:pimeloyl-ACP methyl ester carboxylesterase